VDEPESPLDPEEQAARATAPAPAAPATRTVRRLIVESVVILGTRLLFEMRFNAR
jgi:hypothetical protein